MDARNRIEAHSPEWYQVRRARFTASRLYDLISKPKVKDEPRPYVIEKAAEALTGESQESDYISEEMAHGVEYENTAIKWFSKLYKIKVDDVSEFMTHDTLNFGATPDRRAYDENGEKIILEVKCPKTTTHIKNCLIKDVETFKAKRPKYYWQCVGGAICEGATKAAFISFDPRIDSSAGLYVLFFEIPDEDIEQAISAIEKAENERLEIIETLTA